MSKSLSDSMTYVDLVALLRRVQAEPNAYLEVKFCGITIRIYPSRHEPLRVNSDRMKQWTAFLLALSEEISVAPHRFAFCLTAQGETLMGVARANDQGYEQMLWMPAEIIHVDAHARDETPTASFPFMDARGEPIQPVALRRIRL